jgi:hypothetical protein
MPGEFGTLSHPQLLAGRAWFISGWIPELKIPGSKWGTFHVVRMTLEGRHGTREEIVAEFKRDLYGSPLINDVHELRGCDLLCWCTPSLVTAMCCSDSLMPLEIELTNRLPGGA